MQVPELVNWDLLRQPYNWLIVALMLLIAVFMLHLLLTPGGGFRGDGRGMMPGYGQGGPGGQGGQGGPGQKTQSQKRRGKEGKRSVHGRPDC